MSRTRTTGNHGEQMAAQLLESKGFVVAERNFRFRRAEIDLIVRQDKLLVFVEVKTRSNTNYGEPEMFVTANQRRLIQSAADAYLHQTDWPHDIRFDVVAITLSQPPDVLHIEDAFY